MSRVLRASGAEAVDPGLRDRFLEAGNHLRAPASRLPTADAGYAEVVLGLLGGRAYELLLAEDGGDVVGRAVVAVASEPDTVTMGLYEASEGERGDGATRGILEAAEGFARDHGRTRIVAPVDASTWMAYRFRLPDDEPQADGGRTFGWEPSHPQAYLDRFLEAGFEPVLEYETLGVVFPERGPYRIGDAAAETRPAAEAARSTGYRLARLRDHREALPWEDLHALSSRAFAENPLYEPLPLEVFRAAYGRALGDAAADFTFWCRDPDGALAAVVCAFRDGGAAVVKSIAVSPEHRGRHLSTALIHHLLAAAEPAGVHEMISA
ncbi:MAG TPA: GNAT family N-acetyltransferase, partial [Longimicrobiales bacterium]|nr:GNAT family N-acetyltransferase [Longimicrobiales bacterium]